MPNAVKEVAAIEEQIRTYVVDSFLSPKAAADLQNDTDLLMLLDSLQILRMILAFEKQYGIKVQESELAPENLGSIRKIAAFLTCKQVERRDDQTPLPPKG